MIATPVHTAPITDRLTGDCIQSRQGSRITSSPGPLWIAWKISDPNNYAIGEVIADDMGLLVRAKRLSFLRSGTFNEHVMDIGGTAKSIWLSTHQTRSTPPNTAYGRIYELSPIDFSVRRQKIIASTRGAMGIDGDDEVIYMGHWGRPRALRKIDAATLQSVAFTELGEGHQADFIAGDKTGCWIGNTVRGTIRHYSPSLTPGLERPWPLSGAGHEPGGIGGGSRRIYCTTIVGQVLPDWPSGFYTHTIRPSDFSVVRTYGPGISGRRYGLGGGK